MDGFAPFWAAADAVGRVVALLLLTMSVAAWVLIFWKAWVLRRASIDIERGIAAFWEAPDWSAGQARLGHLDREGVLKPLVEAVVAPAQAGPLQAQGHLASQL